MSRAEIFEASVRYFLEPIAAFLEDDTVTKIMVNGHRKVYIERRGRWSARACSSAVRIPSFRRSTM